MDSLRRLPCDWGGINQQFCEIIKGGNERTIRYAFLKWNNMNGLPNRNITIRYKHKNKECLGDGR